MRKETHAQLSEHPAALKNKNRAIQENNNDEEVVGEHGHPRTLGVEKSQLVSPGTLAREAVFMTATVCARRHKPNSLSIRQHSRTKAKRFKKKQQRRESSRGTWPSSNSWCKKGLNLSTLARSSGVVADPEINLRDTPGVVGQDDRRDENGEAERCARRSPCLT